MGILDKILNRESLPENLVATPVDEVQEEAAEELIVSYHTNDAEATPLVYCDPLPELKTATDRVGFKMEFKETWAPEVALLESYLIGTDHYLYHPTGKLCISKGETITDLKKFVTGHLAIVKRNDGNPRLLPYLERLRHVKALLQAA